jgi:uncharacterized protein (DUF58 family)
MEDYRKYLDPEVIHKISPLDLRARLVVEGFVTGLHRSPYRGFSVEFAEYREYVPGDDVRHVDWKVFGKTDRYYIKQYEEETNLVCHVLLDLSESMSYGSQSWTKQDYASTIAAALIYLVVQQQDAVGLGLFDREVRKFLPAGSHSGHMKILLHEIAEAKAGGKTDFGLVMKDLVDRISKRGLVVLISDFLDDVETIVRGIHLLRQRRHDVIVMQVLDRHEIEFPFENMTQFLGLEEAGNRIVNPRALRKAYLAELESFRNALERGCHSSGTDYVLLSTNKRLDVALSAYLAMRSSLQRSKTSRK